MSYTTYRAHAVQAYTTYAPCSNPDQAKRTTFVRPAPTQQPVIRLQPVELGSGALALDIKDFMRQYTVQTEQYILARAPMLWAHRQFYAYVDAYASRSLVIYIPTGAQLSEPINLATLFGATPMIDQYDTCTVILADDANATIIDTFSSTQGSHVRSIVYHAGARARLNVIYHHILPHTANVTSAYAFVCAQESTVTVHGIMHVGTHLDAWFDVFLKEPYAQATIRGIYALNGHARMNVSTQQQHTAADTSSDIALHGCLTGHAHAAYHGLIHLDESAQRCQAKQRNNTLLISDTARAISVPTLEALAHEVHCTHASAMGGIDHQAMAYLSARGIPEKRARMLLIHGFLQTSLGTCTYLEPALQDLINVLTVSV